MRKYTMLDCVVLVCTMHDGTLTSINASYIMVNIYDRDYIMVNIYVRDVPIQVMMSNVITGVSQSMDQNLDTGSATAR